MRRNDPNIPNHIWVPCRVPHHRLSRPRHSVPCCASSCSVHSLSSPFCSFSLVCLSFPAASWESSRRRYLWNIPFSPSFFSFFLSFTNLPVPPRSRWNPPDLWLNSSKSGIPSHKSSEAQDLIGILDCGCCCIEGRIWDWLVEGELE